MKKRFVLSLLSAFALSIAPGNAFRLDGVIWPDGALPMQINLGDSKTLTDGFTYNQSAIDALNIWNQDMVRLQFSAIVNPTDVPVEDDRVNSVFFSSSIYGGSFGSSVLAVTLRTYDDSGTMLGADVVFNTARQWDSYRGGQMASGVDLHRVSLHEFGHVLGLDHPDDSGQSVRAIMNSIISNLDVLQSDDRAGSHYLYGNPHPSPSPSPGHANNLVNLSTRADVGTGDEILIGGFILQGTTSTRILLRAIGPSLESQGVTGALPDPTMQLRNASGALLFENDDWTGNANAQEIMDIGLAPETQFDSVILTQIPPGSYTAVVQGLPNTDGVPTTGVALVELYDLQRTTGRAGNISTRGRVLSGDSVMIGGLIVGGTETKDVVVRAIGPSLGGAGVAGALQNPTLELYNSSGVLMSSNNDWGQGPDAQTIQSKNLAPIDARESALLASLPPSNYTAIVRGVNNATGIALVETYDLSPSP